MNRLAIFDCDGTLVDSGATIVTAITETFTQHGIPVPPASACRRVIGLSLVQAISALLPEEDDGLCSALAQSYKENFFRARSQGRVEEPLYEQIGELLDAFEADGWLLAVATGKSDRGLKHCLDTHGYSDRFISLQTADRHPSKPHPSMVLAAIADAGAAPETSIVIGDTAFDMGMATSAGAVAIGAGWGYHSPAELLAAGAVGVAQTPLEVLGLLPGKGDRGR